MYDILLWKKGVKLMSLLWTAVVLCIGMIFGIWLFKIILPTGKLLIDRTKDNKNVMTFSLGSLDPEIACPYMKGVIFYEENYNIR